MALVKLNIIQPNLGEQHYSCHSCGNCCKDFTVQLREDDIDRLFDQEWHRKLGFSPIVEFRGTQFLRQTEEGACVFWMEDGRCRIHAEYSFEEKPIACQMFPFSLTPVSKGAIMGINFACQSVQENKGAELRSHRAELKRMAKNLPEVKALSNPPLLSSSLNAKEREVDALVSRIDAWLRRDNVDLNTRIDGLAWVVQSLNAAKLENVRDKRFAVLLDALFGALPDELEHYPITKPTGGQLRMLRQAAFSRTEDPKLGRIHKTGRLRTSVSQFFKSRRFAKGKGIAPYIGEGWAKNIPLQNVNSVKPANDPGDVKAIDDLVTRWLRATLLGGRVWGAGYYGWSMIDGLKAMMLNIAVVGWLARLHAAGEGKENIDIEDVRHAIGRVDRTSGRAKWLGSNAEHLRLRYLCTNDGLRRLNNTFMMIN